MFTCDLYINICAHTHSHTPFILETVHVVLFRSEWDYEVLRTGGGVDEREQVREDTEEREKGL